MNRMADIALLAFSAGVFAQVPQLKSGSAIFIEPMGGYGTYLAAAFTKKQVPLILVADKSKADYVITSNVSHQAPSTPAVVVTARPRPSTKGKLQTSRRGIKGGAGVAKAQRSEGLLMPPRINPQREHFHCRSPIFADRIRYSAGKTGTNQFQKQRRLVQRA